MSSEKKTHGFFDGVNNPQGLLLAGGAVGYLAVIPITTMIAKEGGLFQSVVATVAQAFPGLGNVQTDRIIPALSAFYIFATYIASSSASVAGQAAASDKGLDLKHPRKQTSNLRGLPLRMLSAHSNMMETFPSFALAAALTQALAPKNQLLINLLALHTITKTFVYWPVYVSNLAIPRSAAHTVAMSAVVNVVWQLACGAK